MEIKIYKIYYSYGMHHIWIDTDQDSFFEIIGDMANEFEIIKEDIGTIREYSIINYCGDKDIIGMIATCHIKDIY